MSDNEYESDTEVSDTNSDIDEETKIADVAEDIGEDTSESESGDDSEDSGGAESGDENGDGEEAEVDEMDDDASSRSDADMEDDEIDDTNYLQKFNKDIHKQIIQDYHPELVVHNYDEILALCEISRDDSGSIVDPLHKTVPYVTRYEKARIIGERACQLNSGATPFIEVEKDIIDGETIAIKEFEQKRIPFIIQRPLSNGGCEYWRLRDLEIL